MTAYVTLALSPHGKWEKAAMPGLKLWFWTITSDTYPFRRIKTTWRMTEEDARARHGGAAEKVESTLEIRTVSSAGGTNEIMQWSRQGDG